MTPTPEQEQIGEAVTASRRNLIVSALAGAAKTSTLKLITERNPRERFLYLAFNKRIAEEARGKLPANVTVSTLNALGHGILRDHFGSYPRIVRGKLYEIVKELSYLLPKAEDENLFRETLELVREAKSQGYSPDIARSIIDRNELQLDVDPLEEQWEIIDLALARSTEMAMEKKHEIDFDDQIYLPCLYPMVFPIFPNVMVDEAQDLSPLNHTFIEKLIGGKRRLIAVGDKNQAIYGFRGASEESMAILKQKFDMDEYRLTISFRCAQAITRSVHWHAPEMRWPEWAEEGEVSHLDEWTVHDVPDGAAIICRNNAPLFRTAINFLLSGRAVSIVGSDFTASIVKDFNALSRNKNLPQSDVLAAIEKWAEKKKARARNKRTIDDKAACLRALASRGETLAGIISYTEALLARSGTVELMTGHKSKGLEFDTVFFLDPFLCKQEGQDPNVRYVIQTRAKRKLVYVESESFHVEPFA